ncbi:hypothetical protein PGTUg99_029059 [Puccinia graminis f. sp. tritici]|uniref:Uncharacterized protein n=1 Tax=Puccinia graminis f. sp. tritici TaxID=56615 RepID=A0A5B0RHJ8_PUCGR|nr:hypothetical protein PGTUg99_029059 [Puccinia graminis f. sp. tritici]
MIGHILIPHCAVAIVRLACQMRVLSCGSDSFSPTILNRLIHGNRTLEMFSLIPASSQTRGGLKKVEDLNIPHHWPRTENRQRPLKHWSIPDEFTQPEDDELVPILLSALFPYRIPREMIEDNREIQASTGAERSSLTTMVPGCGADPMSVSRQGARAGVSMQEVSPLGFETSKILAQKPILLSPTICYPAADVDSRYGQMDVRNGIYGQFNP